MDWTTGLTLHVHTTQSCICICNPRIAQCLGGVVESGHAHIKLESGVLRRACVHTYCTGVSRNIISLVLRSIRPVCIALYKLLFTKTLGHNQDVRNACTNSIPHHRTCAFEHCVCVFVFYALRGYVHART